VTFTPRQRWLLLGGCLVFGPTRKAVHLAATAYCRWLKMLSPNTDPDPEMVLEGWWHGVPDHGGLSPRTLRRVERMTGLNVMEPDPWDPPKEGDTL